jgi:shikimate kinase
MIVLVGFMGAGKSTVGQALAERLTLPFLDSDLAIERVAGRSVPEIFAAEGEPAFRAREHATIVDLLQGEDAVLALGGGAVEDPGTRVALAGIPVVFLQVGLSEALARIGADPRRPMLHRPDLPELFARRQAGYREVATITVPTRDRTVQQVVDAVVADLSGLPHTIRDHG